VFPIVYQITLEHDFPCTFSAKKIHFMQGLHPEVMYGVTQPSSGLQGQQHLPSLFSEQLHFHLALLSPTQLSLASTPERFPASSRDITKPFTVSGVVTSSAQRKRATLVKGNNQAA